MKKIYLMLLMALCVVGGDVWGQTPWAIEHSRQDAPVRVYEGKEGVSVEKAGVSLKNLWIGSTVVWNVDEDAPIESPGVNGSLLYTVYSTERFGLPVWGNISLADGAGIYNPDEGVTVGVYPWYELNKEEAFTLIAHGGVGYRRYTAEDGLDKYNTTEIKIHGGLEVAMSPGGGLPVTLSVAPVYRMQVGDLPDGTTLEITGILPIGNGLGLLAEGDFPFDGDVGSQFRMGVVINGRL